MILCEYSKDFASGVSCEYPRSTHIYWESEGKFELSHRYS